MLSFDHLETCLYIKLNEVRLVSALNTKRYWLEACTLAEFLDTFVSIFSYHFLFRVSCTELILTISKFVSKVLIDVQVSNFHGIGHILLIANTNLEVLYDVHVFISEID